MFTETPTIKHLSRMYYELAQIGAESIGSKEAWPYETINSKEDLIALACDMSRHDPRLFDILVSYFIKHWSELNPAKIRSCYKIMKYPQTIAVILEFAKSVVDNKEFPPFADYLTAGLMPAPVQFYFHNLYAPGGKLAQRAADEGLHEFKKWGFLGSERPTIDKEKRGIGSLDIHARKNILKRILRTKETISISDYLGALNHSISRQQALSDLKSSGLAVQTGSGRGAKWKKI